MAQENIHATESGASQLELSYAQDTSFLPELDRPLERAESNPVQPASKPAARERSANGRFAPQEGSPRSEAFQHERTIARLAQDLGYSQDEIDSTPPQILSDRVYHVQRRTFEMLAAQRAATGPGIHPQTPAAQPAQPEPEREIDLSRYDPDLVELIQRQDRKIKSLESRQASHEQTRQVETLNDQRDRAFDKLNKSNIFGQGGHRELAATSQEMARRRAVVMEADTIQGGSVESRIQQAFDRLYGKVMPSPEADAEPSGYDAEPAERVPSNLQRRRDEWNDEGPLARPSHRKPGPISPEVRAAMAAKRYMDEHPIDNWSNEFADREP